MYQISSSALNALLHSDVRAKVWDDTYLNKITKGQSGAATLGVRERNDSSRGRGGGMLNMKRSLLKARVVCAIVCGRDVHVPGRGNAAGPRSIMLPPHAAKCRHLACLENNNHGQAYAPKCFVPILSLRALCQERWWSLYWNWKAFLKNSNSLLLFRRTHNVQIFIQKVRSVWLSDFKLFSDSKILNYYRILLHSTVRLDVITILGTQSKNRYKGHF